MATRKRPITPKEQADAQEGVDLGERIRVLREEADLTQTQLARRILAASKSQVTKSAISQWENGRIKDLKLRTFLGLCEALDVRPRYLVFNERAVSPTPKERVAQLSPEAIDVAMRLAAMDADKRANAIDMFFSVERMMKQDSISGQQGKE